MPRRGIDLGTLFLGTIRAVGHSGHGRKHYYSGVQRLPLVRIIGHHNCQPDSPRQRRRSAVDHRAPQAGATAPPRFWNVRLHNKENFGGRRYVAEARVRTSETQPAVNLQTPFCAGICLQIVQGLPSFLLLHFRQPKPPCADRTRCVVLLKSTTQSRPKRIYGSRLYSACRGMKRHARCTLEVGRCFIALFVARACAALTGALHHRCGWRIEEVELC